MTILNVKSKNPFFIFLLVRYLSFGFYLKIRRFILDDSKLILVMYLVQSSLSTTCLVIRLIGCNAVGHASRFFGPQGEIYVEITSIMEDFIFKFCLIREIFGRP